MESEIGRTIKETVINLLRESDMEEMTEFKLRVAASAKLGLDLSAMEYKTLVRSVMESFLLSTAADDEAAEVPVAEKTTTARNEAAVKKEIGAGPSPPAAGEDKRIICKLSDKDNAVVHIFRGKVVLSIGEHSQERGKQFPTFRGISLTTDQWSAVKKNFTEIEEAIKNSQSKLRSPSNAEQKDEAVNDNMKGFFPVAISRFDGKNYLCWASQMELFLKQLKLAYVLIEPCPSSSIDPKINPEEVTQTNAMVQKWINDDYLCHHHLLNFLSDHLYQLYSKKFNSAKELWEELKWVYLYEESGSRRSQVRRYIEFKMVEERSILEQIQDFNKIADAIVSEGMFLDENFHTSAIISKFPPSWKGFCIKLMQEEFLPVWMLMDRVKAEEELRRNRMQKDTSRLTGFQTDRRHPNAETRNGEKQNTGWKRKEQVIVCNNCGRKGHLAKNCWGKTLDKAGNNVQSTDCPKEETL